MNLKTSCNLETRSLLDEVCNFEKGTLFDLGHPLLNRITHCFLNAAGIGAVQAMARDAYLTAIQGTGVDGIPPESSSLKKHAFPGLRGLAAGMYSGLTYGLKEARGVHDWKNSAVAGAITGATLALTLEDSTHEHIMQCAITGAAISTAANLLTGIF
ncbi:unnamed protein product [Lupinus luteus]|uniref:Uncharacterized protein n=1 Tax=Lupinus luteus TaxID=3873 RepID=A0AAV1VVB5_LUPLU